MRIREMGLQAIAGMLALTLWAGCNQIDAQPEEYGEGSDPSEALLERADGGDVIAQLSAGR
ncbi:MAG: hypothetical protein ACKVIW_07760, partial [bacterium]